MLGAVIGDVIGSSYEGFPVKDKNFTLYTETARVTDDSVLTAAVAEAVLLSETEPDKENYSASLRRWANRYPDAGFGGSFYKWFNTPGMGAYNSWGNGSAMRVSPVGWAFDGKDAVFRQAELSALPTHNHPEGIKGAQATAYAVYLARTGADKNEIREKISSDFDYNLYRSWKDIQPDYGFEISCQKSVPEALISFLDSDDFEDAIRNAIALGGDADTQAAIAGAVAEAYYREIPNDIMAFVTVRFPDDLLDTAIAFSEKYLSDKTADALKREKESRTK